MNLQLIPLKAVWHAAKILSTDKRSEYLMIVLHGRGDSPAGFSFLPDQLRIPGMNYLMLQAPDESDGGYSWYPRSPNQLPGVLRSRELLQETFEQISRAGFPANHVFMLGFSQGCLMTVEFGSRYPHRLAGYIGISGYVLDTDAVIREASAEAKSGDWLITHGTRDEVLPLDPTRSQVNRLNEGGFKIDFRVYEKSHTIEDEHEIPDLRAWITSRMKH